jgi:hypothetical protein
MFLSTSVVMTTTSASAFTALSPVTRPTLSAPWMAQRSLYFWLLRAFTGAV